MPWSLKVEKPKIYNLMSKLIYLDNSATSFPKPDVVYDFMNDFYRKHGVNPGRSGFDAAVETEEVVKC